MSGLLTVAIQAGLVAMFALCIRTLATELGVTFRQIKEDADET